MNLKRLYEFNESLNNPELEEEYNCRANFIQYGCGSVLSVKYGLNVNVPCDDAMICFRGDHSYSYDCGYTDGLKYDSKLRSLNDVTNAHCIMCIMERDRCLKQLVLTKKQNKENLRKSSNLLNLEFDDIPEFYKDFTFEAIDAIGGHGSIFDSYSLALAGPLFKYSGKSVWPGELHIKWIFLNQALVEFQLNGEENKTFQTRVGLNAIGSYSMMKEIIERELGKRLDDGIVDKINYKLLDLSLFVCNWNRNCLKTFLNANSVFDNRYVNLQASYVKDLEVLTVGGESDLCVTNQKLIQLIRFIYLIIITNSFDEKIRRFIEEIIKSNEYTKEEKDFFRIFLKYMFFSKPIDYNGRKYANVIEFERSQYDNIYNKARHNSGFTLYDFNKKDLIRCLEFQKNPHEYAFEEYFLSWMMETSGLCDSTDK